MDLSTLPAVTSADLAQPVSAEFFTQHGATPEQAAALAAQHNTQANRGSFNDRVALSNDLESRAPAPKPAAPPRTTTAQATESMAQHVDSQLAGQIDATFAPPAQPHDYSWPSALTAPTDEGMAADSAIRAGLHAEAVPNWVWNTVASDVATASRAAPETEAQRTSRLDITVSRLEGMWGKDKFDANMAIVHGVLTQIKSQELKQAIQANSHLFSPLAWNAVYEWARYRATKR